MKGEKKLTIVFWMCVVIAVAGAFAAISGIRHTSFSSAEGVRIEHGTLADRSVALAIALLFAYTAYGIRKRKEMAWFIISGALLINLPWMLVRAVYLVFTSDLPVPALLLGFAGECLKMFLVFLLFWKWWLPARPEFQKKRSNQHVEATPLEPGENREAPPQSYARRGAPHA